MNLPEKFIAASKELLQEDFPKFLQALEMPAPISIRVNDKLPLKPSEEKVSWCNEGYYLSERPLFTADPLFHAGAYYVQEASSMFLQEILHQLVPKNSKILDLCAAPGGKSTLISQFVNNEGLLVCNETVRSRAYILAENMIKWGNDAVVVTSNQPEDFERLPSFFDVVVVDAPCSGEGMFRKDAGAIDEWSENNVKMCASRQKTILEQVWKTLKPDGILIYSTCTYNREEDEKNVEWIELELGAEFLPVNIEKYPEITSFGKGYRFFPHQVKGEGFFIAALRKTSDASVSNQKTVKKKIKGLDAKIPREIENLKNGLKFPEKWKIYQQKNQIFAFDKDKSDWLEAIRTNLNVLTFGIHLAEQKGTDFIPNTGLALSKQINLSNFNRIELDKKTALQYLKKEAIDLPEVEKGFVLLTYQSLPIGWVKNLGNRCNNLYPSEWRIRMNLQNLDLF